MMKERNFDWLTDETIGRLNHILDRASMHSKTKEEWKYALLLFPDDGIQKIKDYISV